MQDLQRFVNECIDESNHCGAYIKYPELLIIEMLYYQKRIGDGGYDYSGRYEDMIFVTKPPKVMKWNGNRDDGNGWLDEANWIEVQTDYRVFHCGRLEWEDGGYPPCEPPFSESGICALEELFNDEDWLKRFRRKDYLEILKYYRKFRK